MEITLEVPNQYLVDRDPAELAEHIKLYAALLMFRSGEISAGAAVTLSGVDRFTFAEECQRHGIPLVDYPGEELHAELARLRPHPWQPCAGASGIQPGMRRVR